MLYCCLKHYYLANIFVENIKPRKLRLSFNVEHENGASRGSFVFFGLVIYVCDTHLMLINRIQY